MANVLSRIFTTFSSLTKETFVVGYNDGLAGVKEFVSLSEAIAEAKDAITISPNITIRDKNGTLLAKFD